MSKTTTPVIVDWLGTEFATDGVVTVDSEVYMREFTREEYAAAHNSTSVMRKPTCACPRVGVTFTQLPIRAPKDSHNALRTYLARPMRGMTLSTTKAW